MSTDPADRRFGALRRLYGDEGYERLRTLRVAVVGLGGVGSWTVEALARSGVRRLVLIDFDHVAESNINRQVQATARTLGQSKGLALQDRIADIHPGCEVIHVDEFATPANWPAILPCDVDGVIDACDQPRAKVALAAWALQQHKGFVSVGAAGGKRLPQRVQVADLGAVTHDPLLASVRQRLRKAHGAARGSRIGVTCVFSCEPVRAPFAASERGVIPESGSADLEPATSADSAAPLACRGYGSTVTVTAVFGMVAAAQLIEDLSCGTGAATSNSSVESQVRAKVAC